MDGMEEKIGNLLSNPELMQKIMSMAQALGTESPRPSDNKPQERPSSLPELDVGMLQKLSGLAGKSSIDNQQRALLKALQPYLTRERIRKLENAMQAAKMATFAAVFFQQQGRKF